MPHRQPFRTAVLMVIGLLIAVTATDLLLFGCGLYRQLLQSYFPWAEDQPRRVLATAVQWQPRVVALGDSRTRQAFRPTLIEEAAGVGDRQLHLANAGVIAAALSFDVVMLRRLLERAPAPDLVLIGLDPSDLFQWPPERVMPQLYDLYRGPEDWPQTFSAKAEAEMWLSTVWPLWRYRFQASEIVSIALTTPPGQGADKLIPRAIPDAWYAADVARGWWPAHKSFPLTAADTKWGLFKQYPYPAQGENLKHALTLCRDRQIRPVLVWLPLYGHTSAAAEGALAMTYLKTLGADAVIDMSDTCQQPSLWQNPTHLNVAGGRVFSLALAERLGPMLRALGPTRAGT